MSCAIDQRTALRLQIAAIVGDEPAASVLEIRSKRNRGGMSQLFVGVREHERAITAISNRCQFGDVYLGAAPRTREAGTADAIDRVWVLWADIDSREALDKLAHFRPLPSIVIRTGGPDCAHAYWPLREPISPSFAQRANRRLALALAADRNATDPARILRPAGSWNWKYQERRPVLCTRVELDTFTAGDVVGGLADDSAYLQATPTGRIVPLKDAAGALGGLVRVVREAPVGERNARLNWAAFRAGEHASGGALNPCEAERDLLAAAVEVGLPEAEAARTIASGLGASLRAVAA